ncbi:MAG: hypothetical protein ACFFEK_03615 [Candidatus Thorarchaeota archaeon]
MSTLKRNFSYGLIVTLIILILASPDIAFGAKFPIGLQLDYEIESRYGFNTDSHTVTYEFTRWIDEDAEIVELLVDSSPTQVTYPSGSVTVIAGFPLWADISSWTEGGTTQFGGSYDLTRSTKNGFSCWYLRAEIYGPGDFDAEFWNIYYECTYGFLVFYGNVDFYSTTITEHTATLGDNNINSFKFLGGFLDTPYAMILLVAGIFIELIVICKLWARRTGYA